MNSAVDFIRDDPNLMDQGTQHTAAVTDPNPLVVDAPLQGDTPGFAPPMHATQAHVSGQILEGVKGQSLATNSAPMASPQNCSGVSPPPPHTPSSGGCNPSGDSETLLLAMVSHCHSVPSFHPTHPST